MNPEQLGKKFNTKELIDKGLCLWVVYFNSSDYPGKYVVRKFIETLPTNEVYTADSLEEVRNKIPLRRFDGLVRMERDPADDPVIVEVWI